jgi:DNA invertase Pin-like site-specific DNA recombinase
MIGVYMRVSTDKQDTASQEHEIRRWLNERNISNVTWYVDHGISGKTTKRPEYQRLCADVDAGRIKTVVVYRLDRLGRDAIAAMRLLLGWMQDGVEFFSVTQPILHLGVDNPFRISIMSIFSELAQAEREAIVSRVKAGLAAAKARGVKLGAQRKHDPTHVLELRAKGMTIRAIAQATGISKSAVHEILKN